LEYFENNPSIEITPEFKAKVALKTEKKPLMNFIFAIREF